MSPFKQERGQTMVLTALFMTLMIAMAALVIDLGSWMRAQRDLQAVADAAALAGAHAFLPESTESPDAVARDYAWKNGGSRDTCPPDTASSSGCFVSPTPEVTGNTINVKLARSAPGFFARIAEILDSTLNFETVTVRAHASARGGIMSEARWAAPVGVQFDHSELACDPAPCQEPDGSYPTTTLELNKVGPGAFKLLNIDGSDGGTGPGTLADWILKGYEGSMPLGTYYSDPGAKYNSGLVKSAFQEQYGKELLFPVYRETEGSGANFEYEVIGWAGFVVTSYDAIGTNAVITGHFTRVIWEGITSEPSGDQDFGAHAINLVE
jgi:Putative Flp pilus-assembly TadE/G-like